MIQRRLQRTSLIGAAAVAVIGSLVVSGTPRLGGAALPGVDAGARASEPAVRGPAVAPDVDVPPELAGLTSTLVFADDFDAQVDFANQSASEFCIGGAGAGCERLPDGWTDFLVVERFHPSVFDDQTLQPSLQINDEQPRGGTGRSLMVWDESYGNSGQWGSDAMLSVNFPTGYQDLYVEYYLKYQPGYRWHHTETDNSQGINYAKILRVGHRDAGASPFSFSASGSNGPLTFLDTTVWARDATGVGRSDRAGLAPQIRCDPQQTNYRCAGYTTPTPQFGHLGDGNDPFVDTYGDDWHKIAMRMRLNSAPGADDAVVMVWFDDQLVAQATGMPFLGEASPTGTLLNQVTLGGNMHNLPEPESERFEQWYAIDDVRVIALD